MADGKYTVAGGIREAFANAKQQKKTKGIAMSNEGTLKELAVKYAKKQEEMVDNLTEDAPILAGIPFAEASHGMWNVAEQVASIDGPAFVRLNAPLPRVGVTTDLLKIDLDVMGGEIEVPEDQARMFGGPESYFSRNTPIILRDAGMSAEKRILYDNFIGYALQHGTAVDAGGGGNNTASIIAVRFERGITTGLYSPEGFKAGAALDVSPINGGELYKISSGKFAGVLGYGVRLKGYFGMQITSPKTVGAILNITEDNAPTARMLDNLLADIRATPARTRLYMHVHTRNLLNRYKQDSLRMAPENKNYQTGVMEWNGIPIITSYNFLGFGETAAAL